MNGSVHLEILSCAPAIENVRQHLLLRTDIQGYPMDLFLKISVFHDQANFCWLGGLEKLYILSRRVLLVNRQFRSGCTSGVGV